MSTTTVNLMVTKDHAVPVEPLGGSAAVAVTGDTIYYADNPTVSSAINQGSIAGGASQTFTTPQWIKSAGTSAVVVTVAVAISDVPVNADGTVTLPAGLASLLSASLQTFAAGVTVNGTLTGQSIQSLSYLNASGDISTIGGNFQATPAGKGYLVKEGADARMGVSTLSGGTVVVANASVTNSTRIFLTINTPGGTPGFLRVSARTAGTSFTILSSSGTDTSTVAWLLVEPL